MQKLFDKVAPVECLGWPFDSYELDELRAVLQDVADHLNIDIEIDKVFEREQIKKNNDKTYYLVVTIAHYQIAFIN